MTKSPVLLSVIALGVAIALVTGDILMHDGTNTVFSYVVVGLLLAYNAYVFTRK